MIGLDDAWWVWVCRDGRLLVTAGGAPKPEPTAWPVAAESNRARAGALCLLFGRVEGAGLVRVQRFDGTIGGAVALADRMAAWQAAGRTRRWGTSPIARQPSRSAPTPPSTRRCTRTRRIDRPGPAAAAAVRARPGGGAAPGSRPVTLLPGPESKGPSPT